MDKTNVIVWLLSAVSIILLWSIVNHDKFEELRDSYSAFVKNAYSLHWLSKVLSHLAFLGSVAAGLIGFGRDSFLAYCFTAGWFFGVLYISHSMIKRVETISSEKKSSSNLEKENENVQ